MSIHLDKQSGTYYVVYRLKNRMNGEVTQHKKRGFATKREAKLFEANAMQGNDTHNVTFSEMAIEYINSLENTEDLKKRKKKKLEEYFKYYNKRLSDIQKPNLVDWSNKMKETYSANLANTTIALVKAVYVYANNVYDINNIATILTNSRKRKVREDYNVWTVEEYEQFISYEDNQIWRALFDTLFWTGCRRGEALALQKSDLHELEGYININKSLRNIKNGFTPTKNESSVRRVYIDKKLIEELTALKYRSGDFLFGDEAPASVSGLEREFNKLIKLSGVKRIRIHDIRHSHATILINSGMNIVAVSRRLGHTDINMTLKVYTHLLQNTNKEVIDFIDNIRK